MSCYWELNNFELKGDTTVIKVTSASTTTRTRQSLTDLHTRNQKRQRVGIDLPVKTIEFTFIGRGTEKWDLYTDIKTVLDNDEVWTLKAPDDYFVHNNAQRAAFSSDSVTMNDENGLSKISVRAQAIVNGVWVADGGGYCENVTGYFKNVDGIMYLNDEVNPGGNGANLVLPKQVSGYPVATTTTFGSSQPPLLSSFTLDGLPYEIYDMTNHIVPASVFDGDAHLFSVCQSPHIEFLDGLTDSSTPTGQATSGIGSFPVAEQSVAE